MLFDFWLAASSDNDLVLWDAASGREQFRVKWFASLLNSLAYRPDGKRLAGASFNGALQVWDLEKRAEVAWPAWKPTAPVSRIAYSPDGLLFAAGSDNGLIRVWETASFKEAPPLKCKAGIWSASFGPVYPNSKLKKREYQIVASCNTGARPAHDTRLGSSNTTAGA